MGGGASGPNGFVKGPLSASDYGSFAMLFESSGKINGADGINETDGMGRKDGGGKMACKAFSKSW